MLPVIRVDVAELCQKLLSSDVVALVRQADMLDHDSVKTFYAPGSDVNAMQPPGHNHGEHN